MKKKTLLLIPALLLTTGCNKEVDTITNPKITIPTEAKKVSQSEATNFVNDYNGDTNELDSIGLSLRSNQINLSTKTTVTETMVSGGNIQSRTTSNSSTSVQIKNTSANFALNGLTSAQNFGELLGYFDFKSDISLRQTVQGMSQSASQKIDIEAYLENSNFYLNGGDELGKFYLNLASVIPAEVDNFFPLLNADNMFETTIEKISNSLDELIQIPVELDFNEIFEQITNFFTYYMLEDKLYLNFDITGDDICTMISEMFDIPTGAIPEIDQIKNTFDHLNITMVLNNKTLLESLSFDAKINNLVIGGGSSSGGYGNEYYQVVSETSMSFEGGFIIDVLTGNNAEIKEVENRSEYIYLELGQL